MGGDLWEFLMKKSVAANLPRRKFSFSQFIFIVLVVLVCSLAEFLFVYNVKASHDRKEQEDARIYGETIAFGINLTLGQCTDITQSLESTYLHNKDTFSLYFERVAPILLYGNDVIKSIHFAPDGIVSNSYPPEIGNDSLGFNVFEHPVQKEAAVTAVETRRTTISGPYDLVEGGTGYIIRNPIYDTNGNFDAFVVAIIDWNRFESKIKKMMEPYNSTYYYSVWTEDTVNIVTTDSGSLFTNADYGISHDVDIKLPITNDIWHISVEPVKGWSGLKGILKELIFSALFFITIAGLIIYRQAYLKKKVFLFEHDPLTGLYTRSAFYRQVAKLFKENPDESYDVVVIDIEKFKVCNAMHGQKACDDMLCHIAKSLKEDQPNAIVARYGGDLFVEIFPSSENKGQTYLELQSKKMIAAGPIKDIVLKYGYYGNIDRSIPINMICDRALIAAKSILHNYDIMVANYDGPVSKRHMQEQLLEASFNIALESEHFQVWYQPKFDAKTEKLIGAEALVRWYTPDNKIISPSDFIYIFEDDGLIVKLDEFVFRKVCSTIKYWMDQGVPVVPISVNLSRTSLHHTGIVSNYRNIVDEIGIPIEYVSLELTESTAFSSDQMKALVEELKTAGFRIDMDDFGTGSSSLASINILPFDVIKIDKSLIDFIGSPAGDELVKHTIELAHFKKMKVVAEGVETKAQLEFLRSLDCDAIQGYYFHPQMPYEECEAYLKEIHRQGRI